MQEANQPEFDLGVRLLFHRITVKNPCHKYRFTMENKNMRGSWCGIFESCEGGNENQIFKDIDMAEEVIISFLKELSSLEFSKGFCDSEAVARDECGYAISVDYGPSVNMILQSWKIDGLTGRV